MFDEQPVSMPCMICQRRTIHRVCTACTARTDADLEAVPRLYAALADAMEPSWGASRGPRVSGGGRDGSPVPLRMEPLSLRAHGGIVSVLHYWEDNWRTILGWTARPFRGSVEQCVTGSAGFLRMNWPWCADAHPDPAEFASNIREWTAACRVQVYGPGDARLIGVCPTVADDGIACGTSLWADPYVDRIECRGCHATWGRLEWLRLGMMMRSQSHRTSQSESLDGANVSP